MLEVEVLVGELFAVDRLAAGSVEGSKVTSLDHELFDHAVENRAWGWLARTETGSGGLALEAQWLALFAYALLSGAEGAEVLCGLGDNWWNVRICAGNSRV